MKSILFIINLTIFIYPFHGDNADSAPILYSPWRSTYIKNDRLFQINYDCPFCAKIMEDDDSHFVIKRYKTVLLCMNKYPYNEGHLLVIPLEHHNDLSLLPVETAQEFMVVVQEAITALKKICNPTGFNIGMNIGREGGGSVPGHLHLHILPRFNGDSDFLSILSQTKSISVDIIEIYHALKAILNT